MMPPMSGPVAPTSTPRPREAVIVAGGFGTRLLPLTTHRPKHLLEVGGVPFLAHQISRLAAAGVEHVVLATSYHADLFEPVLGDGSAWGVRLSYVQEQEPLGTGGAIRNVAGALTDDPEAAIVVLNGDVLSGHRLDKQLADFETPRAGRTVDVSLHLVEVKDARPFGCVPTDEAGRVTGFHEKSENPVTRQVNAGCYVFRRRVVESPRARSSRSSGRRSPASSRTARWSSGTSRTPTGATSGRPRRWSPLRGISCSGSRPARRSTRSRPALASTTPRTSGTTPLSTGEAWSRQARRWARKRSSTAAC